MNRSRKVSEDLRDQAGIALELSRVIAFQGRQRTEGEHRPNARAAVSCPTLNQNGSTPTGPVYSRLGGHLAGLSQKSASLE